MTELDDLLNAAIDQCERQEPIAAICDVCALDLADKAYALGRNAALADLRAKVEQLRAPVAGQPSLVSREEVLALLSEKGQP